MAAAIGQIVHYKLTQSDCDEIDDRDGGGEPALRYRRAVSEGQTYPAVVIAVSGDGELVDLKIWLNGGMGAEHWAPSRAEGDTPGTWAQPGA